MGKTKSKYLVKMRYVPDLLIELTGVTRTRSMIYQWAIKGRRGYDGTIVRLKTTKRLGQLYTTKDWLVGFLERLG